MFHGILWNNLFDFLQKLNKFFNENRLPAAVESRFLKLSVYFLSIRIIVWNFAVVVKNDDYEENVFCSGGLCGREFGCFV